ncbi:dTDP-Rha--alpha-D-GlcNAc-pyrophosphate polyprenol alpha-3-L-rhamnosyltransferase [Flavobacterium crocinum]|uniref:dTDP-Rha--alpha-D-GlcNAc-pyrophosphate polyprenol alpha-3-L-rhamnosyltransferase n=1 Tax=Flavobacterium crocinum TaxID=2183896 RepID=A0A2S1YPA2_9FLAO|nr:glycosyltransferase family 2 protein [Flavobacterium crocinum]AWK05934.1 dTDP-Rha--alpha-D-GlcNAc-pyrophosphate polyprenol alpha-3-L-rhamnosyltransferase [Flavobacterium crocinum]
MDKIAVVILNWNGVKLLEQFLPSVIQFSEGATIYVADNDSTDNSVEFVQQNFPTIKIVKNSGNHGFAKGYNDALQHIDAEIYALVNSDIEVTENWLKPILETFENEKQTAIIQPKILDFKNKEYFEYAGAAGGFIDKYGFPFCRGRIFETLEKDNGQYDNNSELFWASGACFFIRKNVYHELGGFDESFFAHQEEIDLCWRAANEGHIIKYNYQSVVYHVGGATLQQGNPKKTYLNFRNSLLMLVKNLPKRGLFWVIFFRMVLDGIAGIRFLTQGKIGHTFAILKAHFSFYCLSLKYLGKRKEFQIQQYYMVKSIVFLYYIKKMTLFKEIFNSIQNIKN